VGSPATEPLPAMMRAGAPAGPIPTGGLEVSSILLGLGVALLVLAAIVFAAVSWSRIGAVGQGVLLVGLTAATALATDRAARRRLSGTAEALGVLTVVLAPLVAQALRIAVDLPAGDDRTWANWLEWSWWPIALTATGAAALVFGRAVGVWSPRYLGVVLVQVGPALWVALAPVSLLVLVVALAAQAAVVALGLAFDDPDRTTRTIWTWGAVTVWSVALLVALSLAGADVDLSAGRHLAAVVALAACVATAGVVAWRYRDRTGWSDGAYAATSAIALVAVGRALGGLVPDLAWWPVMGAVAAGGLLTADRMAGVRATGVRVVSWAGVVIAAAPVADGALAVLGAVGATTEPWRSVAADPVVVDTTIFDQAWVSVVAGTAALGLALGAARRHLDRRVVTAGVIALGALLALTTPALAGGPLVLVTGLTLATAIALAVLAWDSAERSGLAGGSLAVLGLGVVWAAPNPGLALVAGLVAFGLGAGAVVRGVQVDELELAAPGAALAAVALAADVGLSAWDLGADGAWTWATVSITAAVVAAALPLSGLRRMASVASSPAAPFEPSGPAPAAAPAPAPPLEARSAADLAAEVAAAVLLVTHLIGLPAIVAAADGGRFTAPVTLSLAVGVAALAAIAGRLSTAAARWIPWTVAAAVEGLVLVWFRLAEADVTTVEAYTLPLAALLGAIAWLAARTRPDGLEKAPSWSLEGPALAMALLPTALIALVDPGVARQAVGLVAGASLLGLGASLRRRAPLDVGAAVVVVLGLQVLAPYADAVPRWISLGAVGAALVAMGATFEQRRHDLHQAKRHYSSLR